MAVEQTAGKGQMGAVWQSKAGTNLTFSVFLDDVNMAVGSQFVLTKIVSLSLVETLEKRGIIALIKWPNDIFVGQKKIAGVLIENMIQGSRIDRSVVGVGLNVNQKDFSELSATSILLETQEQSILDEVLFDFIAAFNKRLQQGSDALDKQYKDHLLGYQEERSFEDENGLFSGVIRGVAETGELLLEREGTLLRYRMKEIRFTH
jgi:BirA family biotin operon repressor/biotin-[acetyl-CoA-carboxylase] ligase